jgi:hypothetical protein
MASYVVFRRAELDFLLNNPSGDVGRYLARKGRLITIAAKAQVGVRTGALRNSIHMRHLRDSRGQFVRIGSHLNYALVHHEGSKPHLIAAKRAPVLRFVNRGRLIFAHTVMHPGTKPNRYLTDNLSLVR